MSENRGALIAGLILFVIAIMILIAVVIVPILGNSSAAENTFLWTSGLVI
jgi:hypothetical protein